MDIGSASSKALILEEGEVRGHAIVPTGAESASSAERVMELALRQAGLELDDISYIVSTGYGRVIVPFADEEVTELSCHARGAHRLFPEARTVLDMGGQDCKAIRCDAQGRLGDFAMNDKCAAGTGRFLELMADVLQLPLDEIGPLSLEATGRGAHQQHLRGVRQVRGGGAGAAGARPAGDPRGSARGDRGPRLRPAAQGGRGARVRDCRGHRQEPGGGERVEAKVGLRALLPPEPQITGALGAALFAADRVTEGAGRS